MNNFKGGGFKPGGSRFGGKPSFKGAGRNEGKRFDGGKKFGGNDRGSAQSEQFKTTCSECHKACTVPFKPSSDKPVYCSDCFGRRQSEENRGDQAGGRNSRPNFTKAPREERSPRHDVSRGQSDVAILEMKRQLTNLEEKLNRILDIINPPLPSPKAQSVLKTAVPEIEVKTKVTKPVAKKVVEKKTKATAKVAAKPVVKKVTKKVAVKK